MEVSEYKKRLRKELKTIRASIDPRIRRTAPEQCLGYLKRASFFNAYSQVYLYLSCRSELDTIRMLPCLQRSGKIIAVPRVYGKTMKFHVIRSVSQCEKGSYGILEPPADLPVTEERGIMLLPGLGFGTDGSRLGYGGGYYDRYLAAHGAILRIGLAYEEQIREDIPTDLYDIKMDFLLTPSGLRAMAPCRSEPEQGHNKEGRICL